MPTMAQRKPYLTFEHDEFTMKPTLDENGRLIPREDYRISSLNCGGGDFAVACMRANLRYEKNQKREDVKSHHYIISFDPRDGTDNGLTVDRAQELGEQFCKEHFPGHQAIVCTHPDGHNHSGNIHVHIVINSLRIERRPASALHGQTEPIPGRAANTAAPTPLWNISRVKSWRRATGSGLHQSRPLERQQGTDNRTGRLGGKERASSPLDTDERRQRSRPDSRQATKFETDRAKLRLDLCGRRFPKLAALTNFLPFSPREGVTCQGDAGGGFPTSRRRGESRCRGPEA